MIVRKWGRVRAFSVGVDATGRVARSTDLNSLDHDR